MVILPLALLLLAARTPGSADPAAGAHVLLRVAVNCRIEADRLAVQEDEAPGALILRGEAPLSDAQLRCYGGTITEDGIAPSIDDERLSERYETLRRRDMRSSARTFLARSGLLTHVPRRGRDEPLAAYARRLERFCGARAGSVLSVEDGHIGLTEIAGAEATGENPDGWLCTLYAAAVTGHDPFYVPPRPPIPIP